MPARAVRQERQKGVRSLVVKQLFASVLTLCSWWLATPAWSVPPSDELLPASTKGFVSVPNVDDFRQRWAQTQLGKLTADPVMEPFIKDLQRQVREKYIKDRFNLTLTWNELAEACGGELTLAAIQPDGDDQGQAHASVLIVDITGRQDAAIRVLDEAARQLKAKGGQRRVAKVAGHELVIYDLPRQRGKALADHVIYFLVDDLLVLANHQAICADILQRHVSGVRENNLANSVAYRRVMDRVQGEVGSTTPHVTWFVEPFGYAEVVRASQSGPRKRGKDMLAIFKSQGFDAVEGVGGWVHLMTGEHEMVHRTFIFAPGQPGNESRFKLAARMLDLPNGEQWSWPDWIPHEMASATAFNLKTQQAFNYSASLVNAIADDDNFFEDLLSGIKNDPAGPQIDVRSEFVAHLGDHVIVVADHTFPITPQCERMLFAVSVKDEEAVRRTLHKALDSDPYARKLTVEGYTVWEMLDQEETDGPDLELSIDGIEPIGVPPAADEEEERILRNSALTVAHGQFMVATHVDLFRKIFAKRASDDQLALSEDVQLIAAHLDRLGAGNDAVRSFSRTDETSRPTYELVRQGKMPESESMLGRILNRLLGPEEEDVLRQQTIDGSQLPDFQTVRRYLGPAGLFTRSEQDGWYCSGLLLNKQSLYADGTEPPIDPPVTSNE
jgi:hypothetical protein